MLMYTDKKHKTHSHKHKQLAEEEFKMNFRNGLTEWAIQKRYLLTIGKQNPNASIDYGAENTFCKQKAEAWRDR